MLDFHIVFLIKMSLVISLTSMEDNAKRYKKILWKNYRK